MGLGEGADVGLVECEMDARRLDVKMCVCVCGGGSLSERGLYSALLCIAVLSTCSWPVCCEVQGHVVHSLRVLKRHGWRGAHQTRADIRDEQTKPHQTDLKGYTQRNQR